MSGWDDVREAIDAGDTERVVRLVSALGEPVQRRVAKDLPALAEATRAASEFGWLDRDRQETLLLAGAGTISGPAAAASWLCRRDLQGWWRPDEFAALCAALCAVTAARSDEWRAEVAHRVAARIRVPEENPVRWHLAAALARSAGAAAPASDGFVIGWADGGAQPQELAHDPFLETLVPKLFEVDGVGAALADEEHRGRWDPGYKGTWAGELAGLARAGRLERTLLLDGCVSRFLRGGTAHNLRWFVRLHTALEPTEDETAARVRDYVRLLPTAPSTVAELALQQVRRADDLGRLDAPFFGEAADAVLFRPEKKLVRAALTWLDRTARKRDRVDATLRALVAVFASDALDLRERAVRVAARHASRASEPVRAQIRDAAGGLPADLRALVAEVAGEVGAAVGPEQPAGPPPFVPREPPAPIGSLSGLAEEFAALQRSSEDWRSAERFLAALVQFAYADADATREALAGPVKALVPWIANTNPAVLRSWVAYPVRCLLLADAVRPASPARSYRENRRLTSGARFASPLEGFLSWRLREAGAGVGRVPLLLATPTTGSGHIDPDVLLERLERLEKAGAEPGQADLMQAMLRVPREIDPAAVARAKTLASPAGQRVAAWLADGGLGDPAVGCAVIDGPGGTVRGRSVPLPTGVLSTVDVPGDSDIAHLCAFPGDGRRDEGRPRFVPSSGHWPSVLPSHREVAAAHLAPSLAGTGDWAWGQGAIVNDLAEADGPAGAAAGTLLACALANRHQEERAGAVEAFLAFGARGDLPAAETGTALGRLAAQGRITVPRAVRALTAAADAGAHAEVLATLTAALPHALPGPGKPAPAGVPALLALATRMAESTGAKGAISAVGDVAARGGSSRLVKEAARLHRTLST
ncbi:DUF6493 family protein [Actinomadura welshii]